MRIRITIMAALIVVFTAACRDRIESDSSSKQSDAGALMIARHRIGEFSTQAASLPRVVEKIQKTLRQSNSGLMLLISQNFQDFRGAVTLTGTEFTVASLADDLCKQINGTWKIEIGKGHFLIITHPLDDDATPYGFDLSNDFRDSESPEEPSKDPFRLTPGPAARTPLPQHQ